MPNTASRSEPVTFEPSTESPTPPENTSDWKRAIFWNEREMRSGWRLLAYLLIFGLFVGAETFLTMVLHLPQVTRTHMTPTALLLQEGLGVISAIAAAALMGQIEGRQFGVFGLPRSEAFGTRFWQGVAWGIVMITAAILLIRLLGGFSFGDLALHGIELWRYAILWGLAFVCVGLFEEFLFRGYTQFTLATGLEFWPAATMLSAGFGALHLANGGEDKIGALSVFVIGMFFCLTLRRTGNLWFAVGLHAAFDWGETFLFSVPNSGIVAPGHLLNSSFHGPVWLTGGTVGPEGSVMAFVVVGFAAIIFSRVYPAREEN
jgi:membrane protease YdiL (CAAX protease family)